MDSSSVVAMVDQLVVHWESLKDDEMVVPLVYLSVEKMVVKRVAVMVVTKVVEMEDQKEIAVDG